MPFQLLHQLARAPLPSTVEGRDVAAVEALIAGGLIRGEVHYGLRDAEATATVVEITPLGRKYLLMTLPTAKAAL